MKTLNLNAITFSKNGEEKTLHGIVDVENKYELLLDTTLAEGVSYVGLDCDCSKILVFFYNTKSINVAYIVNSNDKYYTSSSTVIRHSLNANYREKTIIECENGIIRPTSHSNNGNAENGAIPYSSTKIMFADKIEKLGISIYNDTFGIGTNIQIYGVRA